MTGTAMTEQEEFFKIYQLEVMAIPTHLPMVRDDLADLVAQLADQRRTLEELSTDYYVDRTITRGEFFAAHPAAAMA